jgi:hypothetical protein
MTMSVLRRWLLPLVVTVAFFPQTAFSQGGFASRVNQPRDPQAYGYVVQWLQESQFLELVATGMNQAFDLPERVWIVGAECGEENAYWHPDRRTVVVCYELIDGIFDEFRHDGLNEEEFGTAVASASIFIIFHEIGHALIDILDLPVTGREEDVVDQFATLLLAGDNGVPAYWAAQYWNQRNDFGDLGIFKFDSTPFSDEHGFDEQRFYNILCWTFGQNPGAREYILEMLPQARAVRCQYEYQQMERAWEGLLAAHVRPGFQADGSGGASRPQSGGGAVIRRRNSGGGAAQPANRLSGRWRYEETIGNQSSSLYCVNNGTYDFDVAGQTLTGTYQQVGSCYVSGERMDNPGNGSLTSGRAQGSGISFVVDNCTYQARLDPADPDRLVGELACAVDVGSGVTQVAGSWSATRF